MRKVLILIAILMIALVSNAAEDKNSEMRMEGNRGLVTYDLIGEPNEDAEVYFSIEYKGKRYTQDELSISGDVGKVISGSNKKIYWDVLKDFPKGLVGNIDWFLDVGGKGVFKDTVTGLMWQDDEDAKSVERDWQGAIDYCKSLTLAGFSDWRLPSYEELNTIVDNSRKPAIKAGFQNVATSYYWSSTTDAGNTSYAWFISFYYGNGSSYGKAGNYYVRCVR